MTWLILDNLLASMSAPQKSVGGFAPGSDPTAEAIIGWLDDFTFSARD
jgi:hypothetical protein